MRSHCVHSNGRRRRCTALMCHCSDCLVEAAKLQNWHGKSRLFSCTRRTCRLRFRFCEQAKSQIEQRFGFSSRCTSATWTRRLEIVENCFWQVLQTTFFCDDIVKWFFFCKKKRQKNLEIRLGAVLRCRGDLGLRGFVRV